MRRYAVLTLLALTLAACGGSDDEAATTTAAGSATTTEAAASTEAPGQAGNGDDVADPGETVSVHYTGTLDDDTQFDSSIGGDPFQFTIAANEVIPGFDEAVTGLAIGESVTVQIPADQAYGEYSDDNIISVPLDQLPADVAAGSQLVSPTGQVVTVIEVGADSARIDGNHELAGQALTFEIQLVSIDG